MNKDNVFNPLIKDVIKDVDEAIAKVEKFKSTQQTNEEKFLEMLKIADPELWALKQALVMSRINPVVIVETIRAIAKITNGSGLGKVEIFLSSSSVRNINSQERTDLHAKVEE